MASLNKLAIRGIRSFDDKQISVLEFFNPVTVIVGHNGSGKTTIIECLKYATTGDQPPNTRGGAFVHDPKMANEKEVKAQVKLRFFAANGTKMLAVRNLSVTAKKGAGLTMKTLESILALADGNAEKGGKRGVISTKCAEMDAEIPQLLGVSKSVLENVIFCHQEDSWWPLAEPAALKKKFDDIFEATRYTKALDNIKALRKDRVAELKAEKERLEGLAREKSHADKLRARISELSSTIAEKEIEYEETKKKYDDIQEANKKLQAYAIKFREIYIEVENLEKKKENLQVDLNETKVHLTQMPGTREELEAQLATFEDQMGAQRRQRKTKTDKLQDIQDELKAANKRHMDLVSEKAALDAEAANHQTRIADRTSMMKEIGDSFGMKGFDHSSRDRDMVLRFMSEIETILRKHKTNIEKLQEERRNKQDEYNTKSRQLTGEYAKHKSACTTLRDQMAERNISITKAEQELELFQDVPAQLVTIEDDIKEKNKRVEKVREDIKSAKYEERLSENAEKRAMAEHRRDELQSELMALNTQVELHANLAYKRKEVKTKLSDIDHALEAANVKFQKLFERKAKLEMIEQEVDRSSKQQDEQVAEYEDAYTKAGRLLQSVETTLSTLKHQLEENNNELKRLDRKFAAELEQYEEGTLEAALKVASDEVVNLQKLVNTSSGSSEVYETMLAESKKKKACTACNRGLNAREMAVFEKQMQDHISKHSAEEQGRIKSELEGWTEELDRLQQLRPAAMQRQKLQRDIPTLEGQIEEQEKKVAEASAESDKAANDLESARRRQKDLLTVKEHSKTIGRLQKEVERLQAEISDIEKDLSTAGTTKTPEDVQSEIDGHSKELKSLEKESKSIQLEKDRQASVMRRLENELHTLQLQEQQLQSKLKEKTNSERQIETWKKDVADMTRKLKDAEAHVAEAQGPIDALDAEHEEQDKDLERQQTHESQKYQEMRLSVDKLKTLNKSIERYVRDRRDDLIKDCEEKLEQQKADIKTLSDRETQCRKEIETIDKAISDSDLLQANLRDNVRVRKLEQQIKDTDAAIKKYDMEEAAKARRTFEDQWPICKREEDRLQVSYSHIAGEISSKKSQLETWENDLKKDFKDINKRYTDQLIRVKMSDMANNDLEKYAKALDNAIMKYHSLKMEEVNDTMRHLWNKTYQGTDIDGIKIRSDVEGGASKRSYNYRVVMTKDQVEMDMRGRCSAGQKMLASIIIRLALSDSFGQNCGILALDEPTNALDTENIDALASSLVDIINERKNHANFQLIIITHDENFLRKLGQSDVMEYYWRVSRDARQKSVIERQRFR
ncbi:dna repair protein rad50 [Moniliophthora roreri MCA 2997]|uniref:DNA repair protein RAD50 n=1 Tax=Moniliophthora roreri (strain MCA 2997) TaxID=1381753 RepID=V2X776_MONRO|nr:dna repair protein rad50 [Moniliophthora roreri MCA 2997]